MTAMRARHAGGSPGGKALTGAKTKISKTTPCKGEKRRRICAPYRLRERLLDHELGRLAVVAFDEAPAVEQGAGVGHQRRAAADHDAVPGGIEVRQPDIAEQLARSDQVGDPAAVAEGVAGHGRVVDQLVADVVADQLVVRQLFGDHLAIGEFLDAAAAVQQHHLLEPLIGLGILDHAQKRCEPGAGADQIQVAAVLEVVDHQCAGGLAADDDLVARFQVLEPRGQRAVRHLDREEFEPVFIVGAGDAVGAQQRLLADLEPDHGELAVPKPERGIARGGEGEQRVGPVVDAQDAFLVEMAHRQFP